MTPWQFKIACDAHEERRKLQHNHDAWMMYHGAYLSHDFKKFPPLDKYLIVDEKKQVKVFSERDMIAQLRAYNERIKKHGGGQ